MIFEVKLHKITHHLCWRRIRIELFFLVCLRNRENKHAIGLAKFLRNFPSISASTKFKIRSLLLSSKTEYCTRQPYCLRNLENCVRNLSF